MIPESCNPPDLLQESLGPFGPEVSREYPSRCLWLRSLQKCHESVPGARLETLQPRRLKLSSPESGKESETPRGTLPDTSGPKGPRDSCSRSGGLQPKIINFRPVVLLNWTVYHSNRNVHQTNSPEFEVGNGKNYQCPKKSIWFLSRSFRRETWHCSAKIQGRLSVNLPELPIRNSEEFEVGNGKNFLHPKKIPRIFYAVGKNFG